MSCNIILYCPKILAANKRLKLKLTDLKPAHVEEELQEGENRDVEVHVVAWVAPLGIQELAPS